MRKRNLNAFRDQHGLFNKDFTMNIYEFVTFNNTDPHGVAQAIEYVVPDLCVFGRGKSQKQRVWTGTKFEEVTIDTQDGDLDKQGWVNGAIWTSWRTDYDVEEPCLHVAIGLYTEECSDPKCIAGHMNNKQSPMHYRKAPKLEDWQLEAIKEEVGEHPKYILGKNYDSDQEVLSNLGFTPMDAPLKYEKISAERLNKALDYLSRTDTGNMIHKAELLYKYDYPVDIEMVEFLVKAKDLREVQWHK